jgi:CBS domain-containing membrane protein
VKANKAPVNLALDISQPDSKLPSKGDPPVARVYVQLACSYLSSQGAPTITGDCRSLAEFEAEIGRLKDECDSILAEARSRLGEIEAKSESANAEPISASANQAAKKVLQVSNELLVEDRMTRDVRFMRRNDRLSVAQELMKVGGFRHVLVLDDDEDRLAGVISHRDMFFSALSWASGQGERSHEMSLEQVPAKEVMRSDPTTVSPTTPLRDAAQMLLEQKIGCLPVLDGERVVGILSEGDFLALVTTSLLETT